MAITSAIMQMRRGEEEYFDPDKMHPGEWAVSTDTKYVRMCFSPGVCVRMATYEAFEEDMEQIIAILEEAKTVQEAIEEIYKEFQEAELDIEAAENSATLSESYAHGGTGTREGEDTDNAKYYAEKAKENIEPAMNAVSDIALNRQTLGYTKKNFQKIVDGSENVSEVKFVQNSSDGTIIVNGTASQTTIPKTLQSSNGKTYLKAGEYILSGCPEGGAWDKYCLGITVYSPIKIYDVYEYGSGANFTITQEEEAVGAYVSLAPIIFAGQVADNLTFYPMVRSADITDDTFEPYVDDVDTRLKALTPVNNFLTTVPGSPLDAVQGKVLNDRLATVEDAFINYKVSLINGWTGKMTIAINKINRQAAITGVIDGSNATDVAFAKANMSEYGLPVPADAIGFLATVDYTNTVAGISFGIGTDGWEAKAPSVSHVYIINTGYVMSN